LLSVGSVLQYHEGTTFRKAVIVLHFVLLINYCIRNSVAWVGNNYQLHVLYFHISSMIRDTVISFTAVQLLYFVFTLRRHFMLLNSRLNDVVMSTVKSDNSFPLKVRTVSDFSSERYSGISCLRDILYLHLMLCDVLELINSSYSLQLLVFIGSKFGYATLSLYILFSSIFDRTLFPVYSFSSLVTLGSYEVFLLVTVVCCCKSACFQVGVI
jgi:hypothetical protein